MVITVARERVKRIFFGLLNDTQRLPRADLNDLSLALMFTKSNSIRPSPQPSPCKGEVKNTGKKKPPYF